MSAGCELYVYYRVARGQCAAAQTEVEAQQARLRAALPGLEARLLRRLDDADDRDPTWMELYRTAAGLDDAACAQIEAVMRGWPATRVGARIVERFAPIGAAVEAPLS